MLVEGHRRVEGLGELDVLADSSVKSCAYAIVASMAIEGAVNRFARW